MSKLSTFVALPIPHLHFFVCPGPKFGCLLVYQGLKGIPATTTVDHKNKCDSVGFIDNYYVVGVTTVPYPGFRVIINIVFADDNSYHVTNWQHTTLHMHGNHKNILVRFGKEKEMGILQTFILCVLIFGQGGLQQYQFLSHSNIYLQRGHATTWIC